MAQWIAHQTSNLGVAGSNPVENDFLFFYIPRQGGAGSVPWRPGIASIAQLAEHVLRKHKVTSSILVGGFLVVTLQGRWSRGMILPSGGRGRGFDSRTAPGDLFLGWLFFLVFEIQFFFFAKSETFKTSLCAASKGILSASKNWCQNRGSNSLYS